VGEVSFICVMAAEVNSWKQFEETATADIFVHALFY
jgi:hypothetical protein